MILFDLDWSFWMDRIYLLLLFLLFSDIQYSKTSHTYLWGFVLLLENSTASNSSHFQEKEVKIGYH